MPAQLFGPPLPETELEGLPVPAAAVLGAGDGAPAPPGEDAARVIFHALFALSARLARSGPLLVALDDAHWADEQSLRWLVFLARRLDRVPITLALARRPREPGSERNLIDRLAAEDGALLITPRPLSQDAVAVSVRDTLEGEPAPEFSAACLRATGGNPFLLGELLAEICSSGMEPSAESAALALSSRPSRWRARPCCDWPGRRRPPCRWRGPWRSSTRPSSATLRRSPTSTATERPRRRPHSGTPACWRPGRGCASPTRSCGARSTTRSMLESVGAATARPRRCWRPPAPHRSESPPTCCPPRPRATLPRQRGCATPPGAPTATVRLMRPPATSGGRSRSHRGGRAPRDPARARARRGARQSPGRGRSPRVGGRGHRPRRSPRAGRCASSRAPT